ncbi:translational activator of cytochrome c oxidase 1 [Anarrhichthys ocellatus]|uniref:translational activator of cytochrome c oxidase 1 n=1 Tax=Anarrhichthys ocellatus TaxID=433405 RepID=UPI0012ED94DD|nr:translational activator of cytochrome c oxidase 1 [Anarrhichthys ocellatus]
MAGAAVLRALRTLRPRTPVAILGRFPAPLECVLTPASRVLYPPWRTSTVRTLQLCSALCAGHNKWSKVKHIKGPKDEARGRMFMKFGMMIKIAVKEGGSNPDMNVNLAHILEQCRSKNMPKVAVEAAIKSAEKAKPASQHMFEARGPGGCLLLIEVLTDNNSRTHQEIKRLLNKNRGMLSDGARHNFNRRGVVLVPGQNVSTERALELAIEAEAEDVQETEDEEEQPLLQFICDMAEVRKVRALLEELGMQITSAGLEFVPRALSSLDQDQLDAASTLIEALNDCPDVVRVWDNIQADS